jgi:RimJ/RimL family protein N-acetyltransferase
MRFTRFGVNLRRLETGHLDVVRQWRNSDWVRPHMRYRLLVSQEEHRRWFEGLDTLRDWYFCAHLADTPFALLHVKNVDWARSSGESGAFVGDPAWVGLPEPARATLALMDFAFLLMGLDSLEAQYRSNNQGVCRFNEQLGYQVYREDADGFVRGRVSRERYLATAGPFRRTAMETHGNAATLDGPDPWLRARVGGDSLERDRHFLLTVRA